MPERELWRTRNNARDVRDPRVGNRTVCVARDVAPAPPLHALCRASSPVQRGSLMYVTIRSERMTVVRKTVA